MSDKPKEINLKKRFDKLEIKVEKVRKQADDNWRALQYYENALVRLNNQFKNHCLTNKKSQ